MDEEILKNLENISDNLEYLIQYLQESKENTPPVDTSATLDLISNDFSSFNNYLKSIDSNVQVTNQKLTAYLDSISTLENQGISDNPELEQFNFSITNLIAKLDDLKNNLGSVNTGLNLNIDVAQIDAIKEKLNSEFVVNLNINDIDATIDEISQKLETLNNIPLNLNFGDSFQDLNTLVTELTNLKDLNLDNLNLDIANPENIQKIIDALNQLESMSDVNLDNLKLSLQEIQKIDLSNIDVDKLNQIADVNNKIITDINLNDNLKSLSEPIKINVDTTDVLTQINSLTTEFEKIQDLKIDLNLNSNFTGKIEEIKTELSKTANDLKTSLVVEPEISYKLSPESLQTIKTDFENIELSLNPDDEFLTKIKTDLDNQEFNVKVNPIFDSNPIIETRNETDFKTIKDEDSNPINDKILSYMQENNKLLSSLVESMNSNNEKKQEVINIIPEKVEKQESVVNVTPETSVQTTQNPNGDTATMVSLLKDLLDVNRNIAKKLTRGNFNSGIEI
jgi:hypothetical protein